MLVGRGVVQVGVLLRSQNPFTASLGPSSALAPHLAPHVHTSSFQRAQLCAAGASDTATSSAAQPCSDRPQQHPQQPVQQHAQQHLQQQQHQQGSIGATAVPGQGAGQPWRASEEVTEPWRPSEEEQGVIDAILAADPAQLQAQARRLRDEGRSVVTFSPKVRGGEWKGGGAAQEAEE